MAVGTAQGPPLSELPVDPEPQAQPAPRSLPILRRLWADVHGEIAQVEGVEPCQHRPSSDTAPGHRRRGPRQAGPQRLDTQSANPSFALQQAGVFSSLNCGEWAVRGPLPGAEVTVKREDACEALSLAPGTLQPSTGTNGGHSDDRVKSFVPHCGSLTAGVTLESADPG